MLFVLLATSICGILVSPPPPNWCSPVLIMSHEFCLLSLLSRHSLSLRDSARLPFAAFSSPHTRTHARTYHAGASIKARRRVTLVHFTFAVLASIPSITVTHIVIHQILDRERGTFGVCFLERERERGRVLT